MPAEEEQPFGAAHVDRRAERGRRVGGTGRGPRREEQVRRESVATRRLALATRKRGRSEIPDRGGRDVSRSCRARGHSIGR